VKLGGEQVGIEGAAGEVAAGDFDGGDFAAAGVDAKDQVFGVGVFVDVDFAIGYAALAQELFRAMAIGAPRRCIHYDFFHAWPQIQFQFIFSPRTSDCQRRADEMRRSVTH